MPWNRDFLGKLESVIAMNGVNNTMSDRVKEQDTVLYLIVVKEVWDRIVSGIKDIEYREITDYWKTRIENREYDFVKISNGYGNATRPYRLYEYTGYVKTIKDNTACYAIDIQESLIVESRDRVVEN